MDIFDSKPNPREIKRWNRLILAAGVMLALMMALLFAPPFAAAYGVLGCHSAGVQGCRGPRRGEQTIRSRIELCQIC